MPGVSNEVYAKRTDRLNKVGELLERGIAVRDIAKQLCVQYDTVKSDIELIATISKGSLTPEVCAEKRIEIDNSFVSLDEEVYNTYISLLKQGKTKAAVDFLKVCVDIRKFRAKLWGLDQIINAMPNVTADNVSFNKVNVSLTTSEINRMREIALS